MMKHTNKQMHMGTGIISLIMIFVVLCMAIISTLSYLSASQSEQLIDKEIAQSTSTYEKEAIATKLYYKIDELRYLPIEDIMSNSVIKGMIQENKITWTSENDILNINLPVHVDMVLTLQLHVQITSTDILFWSMIKEES